jgi:hypothetical protein
MTKLLQNIHDKVAQEYSRQSCSRIFMTKLLQNIHDKVAPEYSRQSCSRKFTTKLLQNIHYKVAPEYSWQSSSGYVISGFRRETDENCAFLGYQAPSSGNTLPTFGTAYRSHLQMFRETSVRNYRYLLPKNPEDYSYNCKRHVIQTGFISFILFWPLKSKFWAYYNIYFLLTFPFQFHDRPHRRGFSDIQTEPVCTARPFYLILTIERRN